MRSLFTIFLFIGTCDGLRLNPQYNSNPVEFSKTDAIPWDQNAPIDLLKKEFQQNPRHNIIDQASRKLENAWPHINGRAFLRSATEYKPAGDGGAKLRARLKERLQKHETFTFAAFGSSVTAGHDNWVEAAWPAQLERILKPTFEKLGMNFEARNRGMGGYGEMPFASGCLQNRAGAGVDALSWEWHMFGDSACERSSFFREANSMERNPVLFNLMNVELAWRYKDCYDGHCPEADKRHQFLEFHKIHKAPPAEKYVDPEEYLKEDYISQELLQQFEDENKNYTITCSAGRGDEHDLTQQMNAKLKKDIINLNVEHSTKEMCNLAFYQARENLFNHNWHPGALGHYVIASQIAHYILENLMQVVEAEFFMLRRGAGPSADNPLVDQVATLSDAEIENMQCGHLTTTKCWTGVEPNSAALSELSTTSQWKYGISPQQSGHGTTALLGHLDKRNSFQGTLESGAMQFQVKVDANEGNQQYLLFCGQPCGWKCQGAYGYLSTENNRWWNEEVFKQFNQNSQLGKQEILEKIGFEKGEKRPKTNDFVATVDGKEVSTEDLELLRDELFNKKTGTYCRNCPKLSDLCAPVAKLSRGDHKVTIKVEPKTYGKDFELARQTVLEIGQVMLVG